MRTLLEVIAVAALVAFTWEKSLQERYADITGVKRGTVRQIKSTTTGDWMWDPNRKTPLDRPAYNRTRSFSGHITYVDESGREYWIDASGGRHYDQ